MSFTEHSGIMELTAGQIEEVNGGAIGIVPIVLLALLIRACGTAQGCDQ